MKKLWSLNTNNISEPPDIILQQIKILNMFKQSMQLSKHSLKTSK